MTGYNQIFAMHDTERNGMIPIKNSECQSYNNRGYGIFLAVQKFKNNKRSIANLLAIRCIFIDIDDSAGTKEEIMETLNNSPLVPTIIIETKNGYHVAWVLDRKNWVIMDDKRKLAEEYKKFVKERFEDRFKVDPQSIKATCCVRMPGMMHIKQPEAPFLVSTVTINNKFYSIEELKASFPVMKEQAVKPDTPKLNVDDTKFLKSNDCGFIKKNLSIVAVAGRLGLNLVQQGEVLKCSCPGISHIRGDKKPSLCVYEATNSFYCFGCGKGGSVIDLYKLVKGCDSRVNIVIEKLKELFDENNKQEERV